MTSFLTKCVYGYIYMTRQQIVTLSIPIAILSQFVDTPDTVDTTDTNEQLKTCSSLYLLSQIVEII